MDRNRTCSGLGELCAYIREWVERELGDARRPGRITIHWEDGGSPLAVPLFPAFCPRGQASPTPDGPPAPPPTLRHGPGFRSVNWNGTVYSFSESQARAVKVLWDAWDAGTPDVPDEDLVSATGSASTRLVDAFRGCRAWGSLIVEGESRGTHRLADAEPPTA